MKVLIMPSWYPNPNKRSGYFFKEQAHFLNQNGFNIKVLMAEELHTKSYYFQRLKRFLNGATNKLTTSFLEQDPEAFSFPVIIQKSWSDEKKLKEMDKAYVTAFKKMTNKLNWFPDIIHLQGMYKYGFSSYVIAEKYKLPLVVIEHSPFSMRNYSEAQQERIRKIFKISIKIAGVSHFHKACLAVVDTKRELEVVWNFMDEQKFSCDTNLKLDDVFVITIILRAESIKGPIIFFDAIARFIEIYKKGKPVKVNVVGLSCLEDLTNMKGIDNNFISKYDNLHPILKFYSWLDRNKIEKLYQKSSVFLSTSKEETYGVALREAMLCGVPVISTCSGGPEDTINEDTGLLVAIGDIENIAQSILAIYDGDISFRPQQLRDYVISQSGRKAFLKRMKDFYNV